MSERSSISILVLFLCFALWLLNVGIFLNATAKPLCVSLCLASSLHLSYMPGRTQAFFLFLWDDISWKDTESTSSTQDRWRERDLTEKEKGETGWENKRRMGNECENVKHSRGERSAEISTLERWREMNLSNKDIIFIYNFMLYKVILIAMFS